MKNSKEWYKTKNQPVTALPNYHVISKNEKKKKQAHEVTMDGHLAFKHLIHFISHILRIKWFFP